MKLTQIALACLLSLTFGMTAVAQDDAADIEAAAAAIADDIDRDGERCISVTRLRSTHVLDDRTLLFYMRGGDIYLNVLRYECRGLKIQNRFSYKVIANRLCSVDTITVLESFGTGLSSGISCGLGQFYGITEDEADFLRYGERSDIMEEPEAVELPEGDQEDDDSDGD